MESHSVICHRWTHLTLTPGKQASTWFTYPQMDGRLSWPWWVVTYRPYMAPSYRNSGAILVVMFWSDRHGLLEAKRVDDLQNRVLDALRDHCTYNAATQRQLFARAIGLLPQLRTVSCLGVERLRALQQHQGPAADQPTPAAITPVSPETNIATLACSSGPSAQGIQPPPF